ncbi:helix-turn-helix domain-containing protein [Clostridium butyricum]|uniref:helix-turn-helix domain-containing protein n=1 Tax=Clostridium butyricum TaxID=1492 RepID=UPI003D358E52
MNDNKKMKEIVARIKKRREELNLSYEDLSKRTGFGSSTLQRYETGAINRIPIDRFEELAKGLEIEPYKLMGWDEDYLLSQDRKNETDGDIVDLHNAFLKLNETGRKKILEYIFDILSIDKYVQTSNQSIEITNQAKHNAKYNHNNESEYNTYTSSSQPATLEEMFTTVAAHNDGIDPNKEKEIDAVFLQAILKDKNKK